MRAMAVMLVLCACAGPIGPPGPQGPAGEPGLVLTSSRACTSTQGNYAFVYQWVAYSSGDTWVSCEVIDTSSGLGTNGVYFHKSQTTQADQAICRVYLDVGSVKNFGHWVFSATPSERVGYSDNDSDIDNYRYVYGSGECL